MDYKVHIKLREKLLKIPGMDGRGFRDALLSFLPNQNFPRYDNKFIDIT